MEGDRKPVAPHGFFRSLGRGYATCAIGLGIMLLMLPLGKVWFSFATPLLTPHVGAKWAEDIPIFAFLFAVLAVWRGLFKLADGFFGKRTAFFRFDD